MPSKDTILSFNGWELGTKLKVYIFNPNIGCKILVAYVLTKEAKNENQKYKVKIYKAVVI